MAQDKQQTWRWGGGCWRLIPNSTSSRANNITKSIKNQITLSNRSLCKSKQEPPADNMGQDFGETLVWDLTFQTPRRLPSTPSLATESRFSELDDSPSPVSFNLQPWQSLVSYHMCSQIQTKQVSQIVKHQLSLRGVKFGTSVITFKLFQFEVRFINSWQTGLPVFFFFLIPK